METLSSATKIVSALSALLILVGLLLTVATPLVRGEPIGTVCVFTHEEFRFGCVTPKEDEHADTAQAASPAAHEADSTKNKVPTKKPETPISNPVTGQVVVEFPPSVGSLILSQQGIRSQSEVTSTFPNPSEADTLFTKWGWSSGSYEVFVAPNGTVGSDGISEVDIGVHRVSDVSEAEEALQYFMTARAELFELRPTEVASFGSMSRALVGQSSDGSYEATVYAVVGSQIIRVTALSVNDFPLSYASEIMRQMVGG